MIPEGWFSSEQELVRTAILEPLRHRQFELTEAFQREDIAWGSPTEDSPGMRQIVSNTGPILHVHEINALHLLDLLTHRAE